MRIPNKKGYLHVMNNREVFAMTAPEKLLEGVSEWTIVGYRAWRFWIELIIRRSVQKKLFEANLGAITSTQFCTLSGLVVHMIRFKGRDYISAYLYLEIGHS